MSAHQDRHGASREVRGDAESARRRAEAHAAADRRTAGRFARLHAATAALSAALTPTEVVRAIVSRGALLPGACGCAVGLVRAGALEVVATRGAAGQVTGGLAEIPADAALPLAAAARERRPLFGVLHPTAALPLEAGGELLGVIGVVFAGRIELDEEERAFLQAFAYPCAQALERARLFEAEREARLEAQGAMEAARRAVEMEEKLLGIVGHDLRTPLSAIRMSAALLFRSGGLSPDQTRALARVGASAARMGRIIRDLLDYTRVRREGPLSMSFRPGDLAQLAQRAVAELSAVHPDREIRLDAPAAAPIQADPDRLLQAVTNLVGNALQYGPADAPVSVAVAVDETGVSLLVHNEGQPIPADLQPEIFEPFRRGRTGGEGGSLGLGLFIVREVVRGHGGAVEVRSSDGEGTTFTVRLPRARPAESASTGGPAPELESRPAEG